jgi:hypothetical protein
MSIGGMILTGEITELGVKPIRVTIRPPQIPYELTWYRIQTSAKRRPATDRLYHEAACIYNSVVLRIQDVRGYRHKQQIFLRKVRVCFLRCGK